MVSRPIGRHAQRIPFRFLCRTAAGKASSRPPETAPGGAQGSRISSLVALCVSALAQTGHVSHIALILPDLVAGGAQRVMLMLAREFVARGHRVDLVLLQAEGQLQSSVPQGVRLVDLHSRTHLLGSRGFAVRAIVRLANWLRKERPDAVLSTVTGTNIATVVAWKLAGARPRLVLREVNALRNVNSRVRLWAMRLLYRRADAVIALTRPMEEELADIVGVPCNKLFCIPNPVDRDHILAQSRASVEHPWLVTKDIPVIISVGRLVPAKDHATLLKAVELVVREQPARLLIVGEGPERAAIETIIEDLGLSNCVDLVGFDPNPWRWMARADLYVLSSLWEGHPNTLLEAVALGCPAMATIYDHSVGEMVHRLGISTVEPGNPIAMAKKINAKLDSFPNQSRLVGLSNPAIVADRYLSALNGVACAAR
jgi:glycosyltransferase involved in cell wall biosynthesis